MCKNTVGGYTCGCNTGYELFQWRFLGAVTEFCRGECCVPAHYFLRPTYSDNKYFAMTKWMAFEKYMSFGRYLGRNTRLNLPLHIPSGFATADDATKLERDAPNRYNVMCKCDMYC